MKMKLLFFFKFVCESRALTLSFLFVVAFSFKVFLLFNFHPERIDGDSVGYYTSAANLVLGNGYSEKRVAPFEPYFFREPGYPVYLACGLSVYKLFGGEVAYLTVKKVDGAFLMTPIPGSIIFLRLWQAFFDSLAILLFFLTLNYVFRVEFSALFSLALSLYLPITKFSTFLLRESLLLPLLLILTFLLSSYFVKLKNIYLFYFSIVAAISILTFQIYLVLPVFLFVFLCVYFKSFWFAFKRTFVVGVFILVLLSPWVYHVYQYYGDIRVAKTIGSSFTHEMKSCNNAQFKAIYYGYSTRKNENMQWGIPAKVAFERSFNGYYKAKTDSIYKLVKEPLLNKRIFFAYLKAARGTIFFGMENNSSFLEYIENSPLLNVPLFVITYIVGILGLIGFFLFRKKLFILSLVPSIHLLLFFLLGAESRRTLPLQPFLLISAIIVMYVVYNRLMRKLTFSQSKMLIFK